MAFLVPLSYVQAFNNAGAIVNSARGYIYLAGTTTALQSYSNYGLSTPNTIPYITANSAGRFGPAYVADGSFLRFLITSADGATTYLDCDNILAPISGNVTSLLQSYITQNANFAIDASMNGKLIGVDTSLGDITVTAVGATLGNGFWFSLKKITNDGGKVTLTPGGGEFIDAAGSYQIDTYQEGATFDCIGAGGWAVIAATEREEMGEIVTVTYTAAATTLQLSDKGKKLLINNAGANTLTIPTNATVPFPLGTRIEAMQIGAGQTTIVLAGAGTVTARSFSNWLKFLGQNAGMIFTKETLNGWIIEGNLSA